MAGSLHARLFRADANDLDNANVHESIVHDEMQRVMKRCHAWRNEARSAVKRMRVWRERALRAMRTRDRMRETYMSALDAMVDANNPQLRYILTTAESFAMDEELWRQHVVLSAENETFHYLFEA